MEKNYLTLVQLNSLVRHTLRNEFADELWVQAETSDVRNVQNGHCYLEFIQKEERTHTIVAKARGIIWNTTFRTLRTQFEEASGQAFVSGIKVLVKVRIDFSEIYGYSLTVTDIDPTYTLGDLVKRRREILLQLKEEGVLTLNKEIPFPHLPLRIAVISSATAAGYEDFTNQLSLHAQRFNLKTRLFPAIMQGERVQDSIIAALDTIYAQMEQWDVVVIIRGGGATSDLAGFDTYLLAAAVAQFPLPILTGIGHERDDTVIDLVAHTRVKTPTAAAEFLRLRLESVEDRFIHLVQQLSFLPQQRFEREKLRLQNLTRRIPLSIQQRISRHERRLQSCEQALLHHWLTRHQREAHRLDITARLRLMLQRRFEKEQARLQLLSHRIESVSPDLLLKRGYSLTLKNGKALRSVKEVKAGDTIVTHLLDGDIKSIVNS